MSARTPAPIRWWRWSRCALHVGLGLAICASVFPWTSTARRVAITRWWSRALLRLFNVHLRTHGHAPRFPAHGLLFAANHVSWLDVYAIDAVQPSRFIAKSEIRHWPVVGWLVEKGGTIFIERGRKRHAAEINHAMRDVLQGGECVAFFPEGTTSDGRELLPFHGSLFQPALSINAPIVPIALRYKTAQGRFTDAPAYVGDTTFFESLARVIATREMIVELVFGEVVVSDFAHRREAAQHVREIILRQLVG